MTDVVAFDLSLTCTGWAGAAGTGVLVPPKTADRGIARLQWIRDAALDRVTADSLCVLEGYSFASRGRAIVSLGELGGVVRVALADAGVTWVDIPPSCRCLFACGRGNSPKEAVLAAAIRTLGYGGCSFDEADALWLRVMALEYYRPSRTLTTKQRQALTAVDWPPLTPQEDDT